MKWDARRAAEGRHEPAVGPSGSRGGGPATRARDHAGGRRCGSPCAPGDRRSFFVCETMGILGELLRRHAAELSARFGCREATVTPRSLAQQLKGTREDGSEWRRRLCVSAPAQSQRPVRSTRRSPAEPFPTGSTFRSRKEFLLGLPRQDVTKFVGILGHGNTDLGEVLRVYQADDVLRFRGPAGCNAAGDRGGLPSLFRLAPLGDLTGQRRDILMYEDFRR